METLKNGFHYPVTVILTSDEQFGYAREPIIQRMPDGSIVCLTLTGGPTEPHKTNVVGVVRSEDDGKSWSRHTTLFQHSERACWAPEMYVEGYKASLVKDTSRKGLWTVSFTLREF